MLLVVDIGNTNTVLGVFDGDVLAHHWRITTHPKRTMDEHRVLLNELFDLSGLDVSVVDAAIIASVVPPLSPIFEQVCSKTLGVTALQVGPGIRTGMPILYENPREVGADRIVNGVGAYSAVSGAVIVVDFGTATTFDAISSKGEYLGGSIAPGVGISVDALFQNAARLPRVEVVRPARVIGRNTVASIQSGIFFGYVGLVDEVVRRMKVEMSEQGPIRVIATGGLGELFADASESIEEVDPLLTLRGLRTIFMRNQGSG